MTASFAIVGPGTVGTALARLLHEAGYEFLGAAGRSPESARRACEFAGAGRPAADAAGLTRRARLVFLTVPDDAIPAVCDDLSGRRAFAAGAVVAHCAGALPSTILAAAHRCGAHVGSMHPMQSFASAEQAVRILPGSSCCVEGDAEAVTVLSDVARALGCYAMTVETDRKPLYHAAGCVASNYLVALQNAALRLNRAAGLTDDEALRMLVPLLRGTVDNIEQVGLPGCLTGPIARGDVETIRCHLEAIGRAAPELLPLYRVMGLATVEVALAKGTLAQDRAAELADLLGGHGAGRRPAET